MNYRAFLFDFDGVIADTVGSNLKAWTEAFREFGAAIEPEDYLLLEGMPPLEIAASIARRRGVDESFAEKIFNLKEQKFSALEACRIFPGVPELLSGLQRKGALLGLVSGASRRRLQSILPQEIGQLFGSVVTAESVQHGKPAPDAFLFAASELGVAPDDCLAIENAPLGIASAKSAGMRCVAVCSTLGPDSLEKADYIVADLEEARRLLLPK